ncbi:hypothetical protein DPV78_007781 [Talaromyces pinophilus]|nr:hypothetical protein DPV78_007781 [Talaromyces pinophilus]
MYRGRVARLHSLQNSSRHVLALGFDANEFWEDLTILSERAVEHVIPRLIGALEQGERKINPCLMHAHFWEGNIGTCKKTGKNYIFDSAAFLCTNEMEIGE